MQLFFLIKEKKGYDIMKYKVLSFPFSNLMSNGDFMQFDLPLKDTEMYLIPDKEYENEPLEVILDEYAYDIVSSNQDFRDLILKFYNQGKPVRFKPSQLKQVVPTSCPHRIKEIQVLYLKIQSDMSSYLKQLITLNNRYAQKPIILRVNKEFQNFDVDFILTSNEFTYSVDCDDRKLADELDSYLFFKDTNKLNVTTDMIKVIYYDD